MRKTLVPALILGLIAWQPAAASGPFGDYCTRASNGVTVCTSVSTTFFSNATGNFMEVAIQNLEGQGGQEVAHRITGVAFYYEGTGAGIASLVSGPTAAWGNGADNSFFGPGNGNSPGRGYSLFAASSVKNSDGGLYGCTRVGNANGTSTCAAPGVFLFRLPTAGVPGQPLHFAFRSQSIPGGGSAKCYSTTPEDREHGCWLEPGVPPVATVPEPGTVILLASGILGLGGFGLVRRRRERRA